MERNEVYRRIDGERAYQEKRWNTGLREGDRTDADKSPEVWLLYIEHCLNQAKEDAYYLKPHKVMEDIRKIAGLAVAAMEVHGCPERIIE